MVASFLNKNMLLSCHLGLVGFKDPELYNASIREYQIHLVMPRRAATYPKKPRGSREERATTSQIYAWPTTHRMQIF
jgi:hypothetical protein